MPINPKYQISAQANFIADTLLEYAQEKAGTVAVVSNIQDLWNQSSQTSQRPMFYICYLGESPWSSNANISALTRRVSREWVVRVKQGRGYAANRGDTLSKAVGNSGLFYDVVEDAREIIRTMLGISEDIGNDYSGIKSVRLGDQVIDCYDIFFSTKNDLVSISMTPNENPSSP